MFIPTAIAQCLLWHEFKVEKEEGNTRPQTNLVSSMDFGSSAGSCTGVEDSGDDQQDVNCGIHVGWGHKLELTHAEADGSRLFSALCWREQHCYRARDVTFEVRELRDGAKGGRQGMTVFHCLSDKD